MLEMVRTYVAWFRPDSRTNSGYIPCAYLNNISNQQVFDNYFEANLIRAVTYTYRAYFSLSIKNY